VRSRYVSMFGFLATAVALVGGDVQLRAQHAVRRAIDGRPDALIDLRTADGARMVNARWRYSDTKIVETDFNGPGADL